MRRLFFRRRRRPSFHDTGGIGHEQPPSPPQSPSGTASEHRAAGAASPRTPGPYSARPSEAEQQDKGGGGGRAGGVAGGLLNRLALASPRVEPMVAAGPGERENVESVRTLGSILPSSRPEPVPLAWLQAAFAEGEDKGEGSDGGGYYGAGGEAGSIASGPLWSPGATSPLQSRRPRSREQQWALLSPLESPAAAPPLHELPTLVPGKAAPAGPSEVTLPTTAGALVPLPPTPPRQMPSDRGTTLSGPEKGTGEDGGVVEAEEDGLELGLGLGLDDETLLRPSEVTAPGDNEEDDATVWSDDGDGAGPGPAYPCGAERCVRERRRLARLVAELRARVEAGEAALQRQRSEVLDLRQQVAMLVGFRSARGHGAASSLPPGQYVSSYDMVTAAPRVGVGVGASSGASGTAASSNGGGGAGGRPAPSLVAAGGSRIRLAQGRARINPALIIQEKDIVIEKIVGVGSFGKVWKGVYAGRPVAIKCFYSEDADVIGEILLMERVSGKPHVLPLEGVYLSNDTGEEAQVALVTPYMENGSIHDVLVNRRAPQHRGGAVSMNAIVKMALQAADGVRALHREGVIHRDLACRNLLVRWVWTGKRDEQDRSGQHGTHPLTSQHLDYT